VSSRHLSWWGLPLLLLAVHIGPARSQSPPSPNREWKLTLLNPSDVVRSGGPMLFRFEIHNPRSHPVEICLHTAVTLYGNSVLDYRSSPIVLAPGRQVITHLLPPLYGHFESSAISAEVAVEAEGQVIPQWPITRVGASPGNLVVGHILDSLEPKNPSIFKGAGEPEKATPPSAGNLSSPTQVNSVWEINLRYHTWLEPEHVPASPLALCSYDVLVIHPAALAELRPRQMEAIAQWVDGGGFLIVWLSPTRVPDDFRWDPLQPIFERRAHQAPDDWAKNPTLLPALVNQQPLHFHLGAGRVSLFGDVTALSREQSQDFLRFVQRRADASSLKLSAFNNQYALDTSRLCSELLEKTPTPLSPTTVFWWMAAFAVLAGAGDYFFLGWFRRRKYTWVVFPILAAGVSYGMFVFANRRMSSLEQRATLRVVDIGVDGRVLREFRFTAILPAHSHEDRLDGSGALLHELSLGQTAERASWVNGDRSRSEGVAFPYEPLSDRYNHYSSRWPVVKNQVEGQTASTSTVRVALEQWTPRLFRWQTFGGTDDSGLPWARYIPSSRDFDPKWEKELTPLRDEQKRLLDPAGRYEFLLSLRISNFLKPHSLSGALGALSGCPEISLGYPAGADLAPFNQGMVEDPDAVLLLALRRDGPNFTCYRKLQCPPRPGP